MTIVSLRATRAPAAWRGSCTAVESKLHQLSPYIGKLKSSIAADLVQEFTRRTDVVADPFCGSGTIPLECALSGRGIVAADSSPYATVLTRAKLRPPSSLEDALRRLSTLLEAAGRREPPSLRTVPQWVRSFFHPKTLSEAIRFADECIARKDDFMLACFLGILHHQRPGFLSYPSSHLVPYLRERNFPKADFPELYEYRALAPRMVKKVSRALKCEAALGALASAKSTIEAKSIERLRITQELGAIVTSPPYMNALDYSRDNRLRLWFLERSTGDYSPEPTDRSELFERMIVSLGTNLVPQVRLGGHCILVVGETVRRKRSTRHPADTILSLFKQHGTPVKLVQIIEDAIPDVRRSRRTHRGTKKELILVFRRTKRPFSGQVSAHGRLKS